MTSNHFFIKKCVIEAADVCLEGGEHHHLSRVARLRPGDLVWLFDEEGVRYRAEVDHIGPKQTRLRVLEKRAPLRSRTRIRLAQAVLKAKPMEWVIQKGTELGLDTLVPILATRCVVKLAAGGENRLQRWNQIARESSKQCRSGRIPDILAPQTLASFLKETEAGKRVFLSENSGRPLKVVLRLSQASSGAPTDVVILAGPEGGWTHQEVEMILGRDFEPAGLGPNILRAETASLAAMAMISHFWNWEHVSSGTEGR